MASTRKLLLADDSVTIQKVVNLTFADEGIEVITVGDGDAAMAKFTESVPDLVMADVNMPGVDGYRICELIKQDSETKHIPVVLLVGSFEPFNEEEARRVGADDFLTKPFQSIRQLVNKVSDLLNVNEKTADAENEAAVVNSFDDTLENVPLPEETAEPENLGDAGMDDEMIESNQIGNSSLNNEQTLPSATFYESSLEETDFATLEEPFGFEHPAAYKSDNGWASAPSSLEEDFDAADENLPENASTNRKIGEFAEEDDSSQEDFNLKFEQILASNQKSDDEPEDPEAFTLDDFNLLELPQAKRDALSKNQAANKSKIVEKSASENQSNSSVKSLDDLLEKNNLSPEMFDALADRIAEKISDRVIRKVVKETISQMSKKK